MTNNNLFVSSILSLLLINVVCSAEVKNFDLGVSVEQDKLNFDLNGELIGNLSPDPALFKLSQDGYVSRFTCIISGENCKLTPGRWDIYEGPETTLQPDGSWKVTGNTTNHQINSPAYVDVPINSDGYFSVTFTISGVVNKVNDAFYNLLELDSKERYVSDKSYVLFTTAPTDVRYISIKIPEHFVLSEDSLFWYLFSSLAEVCC